ncbi:hypothetical protein KP509_05G003900 [Ceratopteris richardii]|uniref:TNase-like domain-containing protein n=1 Tax=Ceratopteris richardii TaxID=49495 RepID=A0A8T2UN33_CERRI|nr:hypothetical protein KP509_05G003900 [Ceratopteris richardii]
MGNILRTFCHPRKDSGEDVQHELQVIQQPGPLGPHGVTAETVGYAALARDLFNFEITGKVPEGLDSYVQSSKVAQSKWYSKLHAAWKTASPPPSNREEAFQLVSQTLKGHRKADVEGLLSFYGLGPSTGSTVPVNVPLIGVSVPATVINSGESIAVGPLPKGVQYELHTLPMEDNAVADGDTLTVYVDTCNNPREAAAVPSDISNAFARWQTAQLQNDRKTVESVHKEIKKAGYKVLETKDGKGVLAHRYRVRLRGIDAPESKMPFGPQSKAMLQELVQGQSLRLLVYTLDRYGRIVADVFCKKGFVQEILLKNGACWHYFAYDKRPELSKWEEEARNKRIGLWAEPNPVKPWEYRQDNR